MKTTRPLKITDTEQHELAHRIFRACYYEPTTAKEKFLVDIVGNTQLDIMSKANLICDYLEIERRGNRNAILEILGKGVRP